MNVSYSFYEVILKTVKYFNFHRFNVRDSKIQKFNYVKCTHSLMQLLDLML